MDLTLEQEKWNSQWKARGFEDLHLIHMVQIKDPTNFDLHFLQNPHIDDICQNAISTEYTYQIMNRDNFETGSSVIGKAFRARLSGIVAQDFTPCLGKERTKKNGFNIKRNRDKDSKSLFMTAAYQIIRWNYINNGIWACAVNGIDVHGRVLVDLFDPVTLISVKDYLMEIYGKIYMKY